MISRYMKELVACLLSPADRLSRLRVVTRFPAQYIYEPWKAPLSMQRAAGCVIGTDYPAPIVDHDEVTETFS